VGIIIYNKTMENEKNQNKGIASVIGIVVAILIILIAFVVLRSANISKDQIIMPVSPTPEPIEQIDFNEETGVFTSPELEGREPDSFDKFQIQMTLPSNWKLVTTNMIGTGYLLTVSKNEEYFLDISYGAGYGPDKCIFTQQDAEQDPLERNLITVYNSLNTGFGKIRLYPDLMDTYVVFRACQKIGDEWATSTKLDLITIRAPKDYDLQIIKEAESILESVNIINLQ
jgi:hypothetical protein